MTDKKQLLKTVGIGVSKAVLMALFAGAVIVAPGGVAATVKILGDIFDDEDRRDFEGERLARSLRYLRSKKLVDIERQYGKEVFSLTKIGWLKARKLSKSILIEKPKKWDGKWRFVIFDVPENKRDRRDVFRGFLKSFGFANIQKSIWVYPYECRDQIFYFADQIFMKPYVRYILAQDVTGERDLRRRFGL